jgi:hypothetical protein
LPRETNIISDFLTDLWYTAEISTATIVVSLPSLKSLIFKATPMNTANTRSVPSRFPTFDHTLGPRVDEEIGQFGEDEIQLVHHCSRQSNLNPASRTYSNVGTQASKDDVKITAGATVYKEMV